MSCLTRSCGDCGGTLYGIARVGPRKVCEPPTWLLISFVTSAARLVLSSTSPLTKKTGIVINRASMQTTMSFTPIDRDFIRICGLECNAGKSFICISSIVQIALQCKVKWQFFLGPGWRQTTYGDARQLVLRLFRCISDHLFERGKILKIAFAA